MNNARPTTNAFNNPSSSSMLGGYGMDLGGAGGAGGVGLKNVRPLSAYFKSWSQTLYAVKISFKSAVTTLYLTALSTLIVQ